jgi:2-polyprenyl-3-methyl-5-hydroxy-6-metoxy-1,4-benzoquinol methylase
MMMRAFFRWLKGWLWRCAGITALAESQADLRTRQAEQNAVLQGLGEALRGLIARVDGLSATVHARFEEQAQGLRYLAQRSEALAAHQQRFADEQVVNRDCLDHRLAEMHSQLIHVYSTHETIQRLVDEQAVNRAALDQRLDGIHSQLLHVESSHEALQRLVDEQAVNRASLDQRLGEIHRQFTHVESAHQLLQQLLQRLIDEQAVNRDCLDQRLGEVHSQFVHIESIYQLLGTIGQECKELAGRFGDAGLDRWKIQELEGVLRFLRRLAYEADIAAGRLEVPVLHTDHPIALETDDTRFPWGARNDNSICWRFNSRLYQLFPAGKRLVVLDLGCAGGGFVRSLIDGGHLAVGLEGSDYPKLNQVGEWGTIPLHLHTCDLTHPFELRDSRGEFVRFDVITAWEVLEHIRGEDLPVFFANVARHLAEDGLFVCSVSTVEDVNPENGAVYHQTIQQRDWWLHTLAELGFEVQEQDRITGADWLRGAGNCRFDRRAEEEGIGFHLVLRRTRCVAAAA